MPVIVFSLVTDPDNSTIDPGNLVHVYRFGDRNKPQDWVSPMRLAGNLVAPSAKVLNELALSQVRFGRNGAAGPTPFVSVATSYVRLYTHAEPWVQGIR